MKKLDRETLLGGLVHIRYTIDQLTALLIWEIQQAKLHDWPAEQKAIVKNATIESGLLSLRILDEFFKPEKTKDRITAAHYMGSAAPKHFLTTDEAGLLNDHLAHLTWARIENPTPPWSGKLTLRALKLCKTFLEHVLANLLREEDAEYLPCLQELTAIKSFVK